MEAASPATLVGGEDGGSGAPLAVARAATDGADLGGGGGGERRGYLEARAAWEPTEEAIRLQLAFAACPRADADAAVGALAERLGEAQPGGAWPELLRGALRASALYGQLGLPESGGEALWGS